MMKTKLVIVSLLVSALASGCIFVSDDDDDGGGVVTEGKFHTSWSVIDQANAPKECADVPATKVIYTYTQVGTTIGDDVLWDCADKAGDTDAMTLANYEYHLYLMDCTGDTSPKCLNGKERGSFPARGATGLPANFLNASGEAVCGGGVEGPTCWVDLPSIAFKITPTI